MNATDVLEGRNLQTEVLVRMNAYQINEAAVSDQPDQRASTADLSAWCSLWNRTPGNFPAARLIPCGDHCIVAVNAP